MSRREEGTQVPEQNDPRLLLQDFKATLKRLGTVLGQRTDSLDQLLEIEPHSVPKQQEAPGPGPAHARQNGEGAARKTNRGGPGEVPPGTQQRPGMETRGSRYHRVRCVHNDEGRLVWRTKTAFPGHKNFASKDFPTEEEAAHASDMAVLRYAVTQLERSAELIGLLNFPLAHYVSSGTDTEETLALEVLDYMLRLPKLSARSRQRVVDAYSVLRAKRQAAHRGGPAARHPNVCKHVHPGNGVASTVAQSGVEQDSDHSSGTSDLPEGVVGAADAQQACSNPKWAQPSAEQELTGQQEAVSSSDRDGAAAEHAAPAPSISGDVRNVPEETSQREDEGPSDAGLEPDTNPGSAAGGSPEQDLGTAEQDVGHRDQTDAGISSGPEPQPREPSPAADSATKLAKAAAEAASEQPLDQQSAPMPKEAGDVPMADAAPPPPPPPSASLLDDPPLWAPGDATPAADEGSRGQQGGAAAGGAGSDVPPEPPNVSGQPSTTWDPGLASPSASATSSSGDEEPPARGTAGQPAPHTDMHVNWGARNGHSRAGHGRGTAEDPVLLSSDSEEEDERERGAKRRRREGPVPGYVKPERPVPEKQPSIAELLQQYRDPRSSAQGRPGSLHRPSMPIFESLRRPAPMAGRTGAAGYFAPGSTGFRQAAPAWARVQPYITAAPGPMSGQPAQAAQMPPLPSQRMSPATPSMRQSPFRAPASQQHSRSTPFSGQPFSAFRQASARSSPQPRPWFTPAAHHGGPAPQVGSQPGVPQGSTPWGTPVGGQRQQVTVEFVDLDSSSGESEDVSWREDGRPDAQSEPAAASEHASAEPAQQPMPGEGADAVGEQGHDETPPPPVPETPETDDISRMVLERDRSAIAAVEAEEWELRRVEIERQAEQARREKKRRRAESELAVRSLARLEDHRRLLAAQESEADERERLRMEIRAGLEARIRFARSAESKLRALNIPMDYDPLTRLPNISRAVRGALRFYHPDRYQNVGLRAQVEAEEMFKLVSRVQNP